MYFIQIYPTIKFGKVPFYIKKNYIKKKRISFLRKRFYSNIVLNSYIMNLLPRHRGNNVTPFFLRTAFSQERKGLDRLNLYYIFIIM